MPTDVFYDGLPVIFYDFCNTKSFKCVYFMFNYIQIRISAHSCTVWYLCICVRISMCFCNVTFIYKNSHYITCTYIYKQEYTYCYVSGYFNVYLVQMTNMGTIYCFIQSLLLQCIFNNVIGIFNLQLHVDNIILSFHFFTSNIKVFKLSTS